MNPPAKHLVSEAAPQGEAPGHPGIAPRWSGSCKSAIGGAAQVASRVWFTLSHGICNEIYWPRIDSANLRDWGFIVTGPDGFFSEEKRHATHEVHQSDDRVPCFTLVNTHEGFYRITKTVLCDTVSNALLIDFQFEALSGKIGDYRVYSMMAPHLDNRGMDNNAHIATHWGRMMLLAWREDRNLALAASVPWKQASVGFAGTSDGYAELKNFGALQNQYESAMGGNLGLCSQLDLGEEGRALLALAFGHTPSEAAYVTNAALLRGFQAPQREYSQGWMTYHGTLEEFSEHSGDGGHLLRGSANVLRLHEDKSLPGAMIASLSIPWGDALGDESIGGYHLVWPRDMVQSALARLALGDKHGAQRALFFLDATQSEDGSWAQNMWLDGVAYWHGQQIDETAFPILLAWRLKEARVLAHNYDPYDTLVKSAAAFLARSGPISQEERWEENTGYSPSTLAVEIAALVCAAQWMRENGDNREADLLLEIADCWNAQIEDWTFTENGPLSQDGYYMRLGPPGSGEMGKRTFPMRNQAPGARTDYEADTIVDGGFLELVRYGLRAPHDPRIENTLRAVDKFLKTDTLHGPAWHRYNFDGYGEHEDGAPFNGWGVGRLWPLLTGERAHYELAAGRDTGVFVKAMESFGRHGALLSEQIWDSADIPERDLHFAAPTGSARPLVWAHAEYVKLLRSRRDGRVFDLLEPVYQRYARGETKSDLRIWSFAHQIKNAPSDLRLRLQTDAPCRVHCSSDDWKTTQDIESTPLGLGLHGVTFDARVLAANSTLRFTFFWPDANRWEGENFAIQIA